MLTCCGIHGGASCGGIHRHSSQPAHSTKCGVVGVVLGNAPGEAVGLAVYGFGYQFASGGCTGGFTAHAYLAA